MWRACGIFVLVDFLIEKLCHWILLESSRLPGVHVRESVYSFRWFTWNISDMPLWQPSGVNCGRRSVRKPLVICVAAGACLMLVLLYRPEFRRMLARSQSSFQSTAEVSLEVKAAVSPTEPHQGQAVSAGNGTDITGGDYLPQHRPQSTSDLTPTEIAAFVQILEMRLSDATVNREIIPNTTCDAEKNIRQPCVDTKCSKTFPATAEDRIRRLLLPQLRLSPQMRGVLSSMSEDVLPKKYIFVTAASSNHYRESQALVDNMRRFVFNKLPKSDYDFYYFDLGLLPSDRNLTVKHCNCTVKRFPFEYFPTHIKELNCYGWKPIIIKAMVAKADVLVYMDTSVRFQEMDFDAFFDTVRRRGAQFLHNMDSIPNHTLRAMFDFYGDEECMFTQFPEILAGFSVVHNEPFMDRIVLEPWVACAIEKKCMCPEDPGRVLFCPHKQRTWGQCHRFDLSSLTLQVAKLYGEKFAYLVMNAKFEPQIDRGSGMNLFKD